MPAAALEPFDDDRASVRPQDRVVLIIEDEPVIAMDIQAVVERLGHRVVGTALIIVTHDADLAAKTDRTLHLVDGKLQ